MELIADKDGSVLLISAAVPCLSANSIKKLKEKHKYRGYRRAAPAGRIMRGRVLRRAQLQRAQCALHMKPEDALREPVDTLVKFSLERRGGSARRGTPDGGLRRDIYYLHRSCPHRKFGHNKNNVHIKARNHVQLSAEYVIDPEAVIMPSTIITEKAICSRSIIGPKALLDNASSGEGAP
jgi:bifunctional N-acetylglucosamine-1-phosphate-uridyltransferase/glucosamine-1-phosphate-acetyltransferase GlmU-like protein